MSMNLKVLLPAVIFIAVSATAAGIVIHNFATSTAGGLPTGPLPPGLTGTPQAAHGPATISADAATRALTEHLTPGEAITPGTAHATLTSFGALTSDETALGSIHNRYASDYPVWVVSASGTFSPLETNPPLGAGPQEYTAVTDYIDGYSGAIISRTLVAATPTAGQIAAQATERARFAAHATPHIPATRTATPAP